MCLISASVSLYLWRWNIRITTPTAVCSTIPSATRPHIWTSATRPHIWTSLNSVTRVQVQQQFCDLISVFCYRSDTFTSAFNLTVLDPESPSEQDSLLKVLTSAAAGSLLIVAAVGIFWTYRKCSKTDREGKCYLLFLL